MKILLVSNYFYPEHTGGIETVSCNLVKHYRKNGHDVRWVAADVPPRLRKVNKDDVPIRAWNFTEERLGFPQPIPCPGAFFKLYNNILWCDIVHLQDCLYLINILCFVIAKLLGKPILITQYAKFIPYAQYYKRALQTIAYQTVGKLMFAKAEKVVFITANVLDNMQHINPAKLRDVVPLGVDTDFFVPLSTEERIRVRHKFTEKMDVPLLLFVGRMVERKGVHLIRSLIEKHREWHWVLVGRPDDYNPGEWGMSNLTYLSNATEQELKELYASADLLIHPSMGEGVTLIASESMASGTPVVISQESLYEINDDDRKLFLGVDTKIEAIEERIVYALANPKQLLELRVLCREYALKSLSWMKMAEKYLLILKGIVSSRDGGST